jgi:hypothetical protein
LEWHRSTKNGCLTHCPGLGTWLRSLAVLPFIWSNKSGPNRLVHEDSARGHWEVLAWSRPWSNSWELPNSFFENTKISLCSSETAAWSTGLSRPGRTPEKLAWAGFAYYWTPRDTQRTLLHRTELNSCGWKKHLNVLPPPH